VTTKAKTEKPPQVPSAAKPAWEKSPERFPASTRTTPTIDPDLLPEPLREWAIDTTRRASLSLDAIIPAILVTLAATIGNRFRIKPKMHDPWLVVPNLWGALVQPPGNMKTYVLGAALRFLRDIETEQRQAYDQERIAHEVDAGMQAAEIANLEEAMKTLMKKGAPKADLQQVRENLIAAKTREATIKITPPTLIVNDATTESLLELTKENPRGLLLVRDELHGWYMSLQKQGREGDRSLWLEAHDGDKPYTQNRIKRGATVVPIVTWSVLGGIQPAKLLTMQEEAINGTEADGLLQRFQILIWPNALPEYKRDDRKPLLDVENRVRNVYRKLYDLKPKVWSDAEAGYHEMRFAPDAQERFFVWLDELEREVRDPSTHTKPAWASYLGKTRSLMPTLALILHLVDTVTEQTKQPDITLDATERAARIVAYLKGHAEKLYAPELDKPAFTARMIAAKIADGSIPDGCTIRDIYRPGWQGLGQTEVEAGLGYLEKLGWLRIEEQRKDTGRPSSIVRLHPDAIRLAQETE
jgi:hypothetical protein